MPLERTPLVTLYLIERDGCTRSGRRISLKTAGDQDAKGAVRHVLIAAISGRASPNGIRWSRSLSRPLATMRLTTTAEQSTAVLGEIVLRMP